MDSKGIATIDFLFTIFLMLIISIGVLNLIEDKLNTTKNIEEDIQGRLILNKVSDSINQLNSNGKGYSKKIDLPQSIANHNYIIIIESNEIIL